MTDLHRLVTAPRLWAHPCAYAVRYLRPEDALDLGRLLHRAPTLPHPVIRSSLGGWIDYALGLLAGSAGPLLDGCSFVVEGRRDLLGALVVVRQAPQTLLTDLVVHPDFQGQGLGTALLAASLSALLRSGYPTLQAQVAPDSSHARFLIHNGWERLLDNQR